jgi:hypothetical protein
MAYRTLRTAASGEQQAGVPQPCSSEANGGRPYRTCGRACVDRRVTRRRPGPVRPRSPDSQAVSDDQRLVGVDRSYCALYVLSSVTDQAAYQASDLLASCSGVLVLVRGEAARRKPDLRGGISVGMCMPGCQPESHLKRREVTSGGLHCVLITEIGGYSLPFPDRS